MIAYDAGHGGPDRGVVPNPPAPIDEAALTFDLVDMLTDIHAAVFTDEPYVRIRDNDLYDPPLATRNDIANEAGADLVISVHANASSLGFTGRGGLALHWPGNVQGRHVADQINRSLPIKAATCNSPPATRTLWPRAHAVCRAYTATCIVVEVCYLDRPEEAARISQWEVQEATCLAILSGVALHRADRIPF